MAIYLLWMNIDKKEFIGTGAWYFFLLNSIKVPFLMHAGLITFSSFRFNLFMIPFVVIGSFAGLYLVKKINQKGFEIAVTVMVVLAGIKLLT